MLGKMISCLENFNLKRDTLEKYSTNSYTGQLKKKEKSQEKRNDDGDERRVSTPNSITGCQLREKHKIFVWEIFSLVKKKK